MNYFFSRPSNGYHLSSDGIVKVENKYGAKFLGPYCIRDKRESWSEQPVDVFYQPNPDTSKGHSEYFGIYMDALAGSVYICNAQTAFSEPMTGIVADNGQVVVSRWRHECRRSLDGSVTIDGGRDYVRLIGDKSINAKKVKVGIRAGEFYVIEDENVNE